MEMILNYLSNGQEDSISSTITLTENVMLMSITSSDKDRFGMKALKAIAQLSNNQDAKNIVQKVLNNQQASSNDIKNALTELKKVL